MPQCIARDDGRHIWRERRSNCHEQRAQVDNIVAHWLLGLHRAVPGPYATAVEVGLVMLGIAMLVLGLWREVRAR